MCLHKHTQWTVKVYIFWLFYKMLHLCFVVKLQIYFVDWLDTVFHLHGGWVGNDFFFWEHFKQNMLELWHTVWATASKQLPWMKTKYDNPKPCPFRYFHSFHKIHGHAVPCFTFSCKYYVSALTERLLHVYHCLTQSHTTFTCTQYSRYWSVYLNILLIF